MLLALARLTRGCRQDETKNLLARLVDGHPAVEDRAAIDVHVVFHALVKRRIRRELERRRGLAAVDGAASRGEADEDAAPSTAARDRKSTRLNSSHLGIS